MLNINRRNYKEAILELNNNMFTCKNTDVLDKLQDIRMLFQEESKCNTLLAAIIALNEKKITEERLIYIEKIISIIGGPILKERLEFLLFKKKGEKTKDEIIADLRMQLENNSNINEKDLPR